MIEKVYRFIEEYQMLSDCGHLIIGLSGGADSVCLLRVLHTVIRRYGLPVSLTAVHVNHGIRGAEAARDEAFVKDLCEQMDVPCVCCHMNVPQLARRERLTEEEAGRRVRYDAFAKEARRLKEQDGQAVRIAVAHHMDDQAETVLMNLLRGSSLKGLGGMSPVRGEIIRPLLCVTRREIEAFLKRCGQPFVTDSTNTDSGYTRNRLRNEWIPALQEQFNPNLTKHLSALAADLQQVEQYVDAQAERLCQSCVLWEDVPEGQAAAVSVSDFNAAAPALRHQLIYRLLVRLAGKQKDLYRTHINSVVELFDVSVGKKLDLPYGICAERTYDKVRLYRKPSVSAVCKSGRSLGEPPGKRCFKTVIPLAAVREASVCIPVNQWIYAGAGKSVFALHIRLELVSPEELERLKNADFSLNYDYTKYFDYDKMRDNLCIRFRQDGDYMTVCRNGSGRKLKKELIDRKIPAADRDTVLLVAQEQDVLWAVGIRRSEAYPVEPSTVRCIRVSVVVQEEG